MAIPQPQTSSHRVVFLDAPPDDDAIVPLATAEGLTASLPGAGIDDQTLRAADAILTWRAPIDAAMIARAVRCQVIVVLGPGCGPGAPRIDLEAARRAGIYVGSVPDFAGDTWAGHAMDRIVAAASVLVRRREPPDAQPPIEDRRRLLRGLRLGLVGLGQVGMRVAKRAAEEGGMDLWACDPFCERNNFDVLGVREAPLEELLGLAQVVSLHVPLGPATRGMLDAGRLNLLQRGSALICCAAPELIDLQALARGLARGRPAVAAIDSANPLTPSQDGLNDLPGLLHCGGPPEPTPADWRAAIQSALAIARTTFGGGRPLHLLIDPPCPRGPVPADGLEAS